MPFYIKKNKLRGTQAIVKNNTIDRNIISNHINISTSNRLFGKNATDSKPLYSYQDPYYNNLGKFIRNPSCWINGVSNTSCICAGQLSGWPWNQRGATLITKKHVLMASHYSIGILSGGTPLIFVDENNNVVRRNLTGYIPDPIPNTQDLSIGVLDSEVPENIKIAKILPANFADYLNGSLTNQTYTLNPLLYAVGFDQEHKALLKLCYFMNQVSKMVYVTDFNLAGSPYSTMVPQPQQFSSFNETVEGGDSGQPAFLIIDNELVLLTSWFGPTNGPFTTYRYDDIVNYYINQLSPGEGYVPTTIDLASVYAKYS